MTAPARTAAKAAIQMLTPWLLSAYAAYALTTITPP